MKYQLKCAAIALCALSLVFAACGGEGSGGDVSRPLTDTEAASADADSLGADDFIFEAEDDCADSVTGNFTLPTGGAHGAAISWVSGEGTVISIDAGGNAVVVRPAFGTGDAVVTLTATVAKGDAVEAREITLTVKETPPTDAEAVTADAGTLDADDLIFSPGNTPLKVTGDFTLPTGGTYGTAITWAEKTDAGNNIALSGPDNSAASVTWPEASGFGPYTAVLTATISKGGDQTTKDIVVAIYPPEKTKVSATAHGVTFKMVLAPGGKTFPTGPGDDGTTTVSSAYWIGETEVTYELWNAVYVWATSGSGAPGAGQYIFASAGMQGSTSGGGTTNQHPVTAINWRDAMVWCNALTEWYNAQEGTSYLCVYTSDGEYGTPIRTSTNTSVDAAPSDGILDNSLIPGSEDCPYVHPDAKGFRLATSAEWELAARYRGIDATNVVTSSILGTDFSQMPDKWTRGDSASGGNGGYTGTNSTDYPNFNPVAWYGNSAASPVGNTTMTQPVGLKTGNTLGLYDMSGNVHEWCYDWHPAHVGSQRVFRGGSFVGSAEYLRVGLVRNFIPNSLLSNLGFRLARNQ